MKKYYFPRKKAKFTYSPLQRLWKNKQERLKIKEDALKVLKPDAQQLTIKNKNFKKSAK